MTMRRTVSGGSRSRERKGRAVEGGSGEDPSLTTAGRFAQGPPRTLFTPRSRSVKFAAEAVDGADDVVDVLHPGGAIGLPTFAFVEAAGALVALEHPEDRFVEAVLHKLAARSCHQHPPHAASVTLRIHVQRINLPQPLRVPITRPAERHEPQQRLAGRRG